MDVGSASLFGMRKDGNGSLCSVREGPTEALVNTECPDCMRHLERSPTRESSIVRCAHYEGYYVRLWQFDGHGSTDGWSIEGPCTPTESEAHFEREVERVKSGAPFSDDADLVRVGGAILFTSQGDVLSDALREFEQREVQLVMHVARVKGWVIA